MSACLLIQSGDWMNIIQDIPNLPRAEDLIEYYYKRNMALGLTPAKEKSI